LAWRTEIVEQTTSGFSYLAARNGYIGIKHSDDSISIFPAIFAASHLSTPRRTAYLILKSLPIKD
jgi:hypothetical protein